jgi:proton glutamate symport protein
MARTSVNVIGNCLATAVIARWEGQLQAPAQSVPSSAPAAMVPEPES